MPILLSLFFGCDSCSNRNLLKIKIIDKYNTPSFHYIVTPSNNTGQRFGEGTADNSGTGELTLQISVVVDLAILAQLDNGDWQLVGNISASEIDKALNNKKTIVRNISLIPAQKKISFECPNVKGINIYGVNTSNQRALLGTTNSSGKIEITILQKTYKSITLSYSLPGAFVFTNESNIYTYENLPRRKELKAIPSQDIIFDFECIDSETKDSINNVKITSSGDWCSAITQSSGTASCRITPNKESGPFIGDNISWTFDSDQYVNLNPISRIISTTPPAAISVEMKRRYKITINALEEKNPIPKLYITINNKNYSPTDEKGNVTYYYFSEDMNKTVTVGIEETKGISAKPQSIKLGKVSRNITLKVETIHLFIRCLNTVTNETIESVTISAPGIQASKVNGGTKTKLLFPKVGDYAIKIKESSGLYNEKQTSLSVSNTSLGDTKTIYLDPISRIDFVFVDAITQKSVSNPILIIDGQKVTAKIQNGKYSHTFKEDNSVKIEVLIEAENYASKQITIDRQIGITPKRVELDELLAILIIQSQEGKPAPAVQVSEGTKRLGESDGQGHLVLSPLKEGQDYDLTFSSESGFYEESHLRFKFEYNGQQVIQVVQKQPWIEFNVFQPSQSGNIAIAGVRARCSSGQVGITGENGLFRYRIVDTDNEIIFTFEKSGYEQIELILIANQGDQEVDVPMPRLEAFFYVRDSRTETTIPYVPIWVNGIQETLTDENGRAYIFPPRRPMELKIEVKPAGNDYLATTINKEYTQSNLDVVYLEPRPIKIHVTLKWAGSGLPVNGDLEIMPSHLTYHLNRGDQGKHSFDYFEKNRDPKLVITAMTSTNNPLTKEIPISLSMATNGEINLQLNLQPRPRITVSVDAGVLLSIYRHTINNTLVPIGTGLMGGYVGELPDFGGYTFVRYSGSFVEPDSIYKIVTKSDEYLDLKRQPLCAEADLLFANHSWQQFIEKVNNISEEADCYAIFNKHAAEVCMDELKKYREALAYYQKITSGPVVSLIEGIDPTIDPYIRLKMLECCFLEVQIESQYNADNQKIYELGKRQAKEFDNLLQMLLPSNSAQAQSKKEFLYCKLLIDEFWNLEPTTANISAGLNVSAIKDYREELYAMMLLKIETYQRKYRSPGFPSLQNELVQLQNTNPWP